jgi:hypothetical protein
MRKPQAAPGLANTSLASALTPPHAASPPQTVVIDCRAHMLGRLASVIAKELLAGQHIVRVC